MIIVALFRFSRACTHSFDYCKLHTFRQNLRSTTTQVNKTGDASRDDNPIKTKNVTCPLPVAYTPEFVERGWYDWWQEEVFKKTQRVPDDHKRPYVLCLPPPNVTGTLHLGHALSTTIQDVLIRWHRMRGERTVWVPGLDHAGIATQVIVEKKLWEERGVRRVDMEREAFVREIGKWKDEKGGVILEQMKKLGASLDWDRHCFTMDEKHSLAVSAAFIRLHNDGLIYRSQRLVNWCCNLMSTISDIEVDNIEIDGPTALSIPGYDKKVTFGKLESFDYRLPLSDEYITVATTRLETMLGDAAIAVHPGDPRYTHLHNKHVQHPFSGRTIPVICDDSVNPDFGTGAVKVTPAHDFSDYSLSQRHNLPIYTVIDDTGVMVEVPTEFLGLPRFRARDAVRNALIGRGLYRGSVDHSMTLPVCSRTGDVVEPLLKHQWFLDCRHMAEKAVEAVKCGHLKITPSMFEKQWYHWLTDVRDWCISRQLWWGHRVPAYFIKPKDSCDSQGIWVSGSCLQDAQHKAVTHFSMPLNQIHISQDEDVLDTWFSSALFPLSVFGWPQETTDFKRLYPLSLMETGHDILYFWVARMVMVGQYLTGQLPFTEVLLHATLRDTHGKKMSKSVGNVIDPMHVIHGVSLPELQKGVDDSHMDAREKKRAKKAQQKDFPQGIPACGTDSLRFTLCCHNFQGDAIHFDVVRAMTNRHFCNKLWQAFRFMSLHVRDDFIPSSHLDEDSMENVADQWILSRLSHLVNVCNDQLGQYNFYVVTRALRQFCHHELCDVYLECLKPTLNLGDPHSSHQGHQVLYRCFDAALRLLSPFMPYITEELYQRLPGPKESRAESICVAQYPTNSQYSWRNETIESNMADIQVLSTKLLNLRKDIRIKEKTNVVVQTDEVTAARLSPYASCLRTLSRASHVTFQSDPPGSDGWVCVSVKPTYHVHLFIKDLMDVEGELHRLYQRHRSLCATVLSLTTSSSQPCDALPKLEKYRREMEQLVELTASLEQLCQTSNRNRNISET